MTEQRTLLIIVVLACRRRVMHEYMHDLKPPAALAGPFCKAESGRGTARDGAGEAQPHGGRGQRPRLGARSSGRRVARKGHEVPDWGEREAPYATPLGGSVEIAPDVYADP